MTARDGFAIPGPLLSWAASSPCVGVAIIGLGLAPAVAAPTVTIVSPTPGAAPGSAGGVSASWAVARLTPVVVDLDGSGLTFASVVVRYPADGDDIIERVMYRRGKFRADFLNESRATQVSPTKLRLSILPNGGWPSFRAIAELELDVDAVGGGVLSDVVASS